MSPQEIVRNPRIVTAQYFQNEKLWKAESFKLILNQWCSHFDDKMLTSNMLLANSNLI